MRLPQLDLALRACADELHDSDELESPDPDPVYAANRLCRERSSDQTQALMSAAIGRAVGVALWLWTGRFLASILYGLTPRDPTTVASAAAARADPTTSLKQE
jgi:hypothetical protein